MANAMTDTFDAVLAEVRRVGLLGMPNAFDRLSAARAAEVAEARRTADYWKAELIEANKVLDTLRRQSEETARALHAEATEHKARAEAAERDARRYRWLRRKLSINAVRGLSSHSNGKDYQADFDTVIDAAIAITEQG